MKVILLTFTLLALTACGGSKKSKDSYPFSGADLGIKVNTNNIGDYGSAVYSDLLNGKDPSNEKLLNALVEMQRSHFSDSSKASAGLNQLDIIKIFKEDLVTDKSSDLHTIKMTYESNLENLIDQKLDYNPEAVNIFSAFNGEMQCYSGTLNLEIARRSTGDFKAYEASHPVIIFEPRHVLPGYMTKVNGKWRMTGVESTVTGRGEKKYGDVSSLKGVRVLAAPYFFILDIFKFDTINMQATFEKALIKTADYYGIPLSPLEDTVDFPFLSIGTEPVMTLSEVVLSSDSSSKGLSDNLNTLAHAFGKHYDLEPGKQSRKLFNEVPLDSVGTELYASAASKLSPNGDGGRPGGPEDTAPEESNVPVSESDVKTPAPEDEADMPIEENSEPIVQNMNEKVVGKIIEQSGMEASEFNKLASEMGISSIENLQDPKLLKANEVEELKKLSSLSAEFNKCINDDCNTVKSAYYPMHLNKGAVVTTGSVLSALFSDYDSSNNGFSSTERFANFLLEFKNPGINKPAQNFLENCAECTEISDAEALSERALDAAEAIDISSSSSTKQNRASAKSALGIDTNTDNETLEIFEALVDDNETEEGETPVSKYFSRINRINTILTLDSIGENDENQNEMDLNQMKLLLAFNDVMTEDTSEIKLAKESFIKNLFNDEELPIDEKVKLAYANRNINTNLMDDSGHGYTVLIDKLFEVLLENSIEIATAIGENGTQVGFETLIDLYIDYKHPEQEQDRVASVKESNPSTDVEKNLNKGTLREKQISALSEIKNAAQTIGQKDSSTEVSIEDPVPPVSAEQALANFKIIVENFKARQNRQSLLDYKEGYPNSLPSLQEHNEFQSPPLGLGFNLGDFKLEAYKEVEPRDLLSSDGYFFMTKHFFEDPIVVQQDSSLNRQLVGESIVSGAKEAAANAVSGAGQIIKSLGESIQDGIEEYQNKQATPSSDDESNIFHD